METNEEIQSSIEVMQNFTLEPENSKGEGGIEVPSGMQEEKKEEHETNIEVPDVNEEGGSTEETNSKYYNEVYDTWREQGFLVDAPELDKEKVLTNEELVSIIEENQRKAAKKMFEDEFLSKFDDDDAREYIDYVLKGGRSEDFFKQRMSSPALDIDGDISDERVQDKVIAKYLSEFGGMEQAEISEQIQMLNDSGKKEKYAKMYLDKIHQYDEAQKENLRKERELYEQQQQEQYKRTVETFDTTIKATDSIFGVKCDEPKRRRIMDMMFKPVKLQDGSTNTEFNVRLYAAMQDPKKAIILADLLANDFDVSKYSKSIETQVTKKIRGGLNNPPKR